MFRGNRVYRESCYFSRFMCLFFRFGDPNDPSLPAASLVIGSWRLPHSSSEPETPVSNSVTLALPPSGDGSSSSSSNEQLSFHEPLTQEFLMQVALAFFMCRMPPSGVIIRSMLGEDGTK